MPWQVADKGPVRAALSRLSLWDFEAMVSTSFGSFDAPVLLDGFEPDGENVDAAEAPDDDVAHRPVLAGVPRVGTRKGLRARALRTRECEEHDHQEERELDFPVNRHVDGRDESQDEAQRYGSTDCVLPRCRLH